MPDIGLLIAFVLAVALLTLTPGPDMLFIVAIGARGGPAIGLFAAFGVAAGLAVHALATALGLAVLFAAVPALYIAVKFAGAGYLLFLGIRTLLRSGRAWPADGNADHAVRHAKAFGQGMLTNLLNPKVVLFNAAFLPQFIDPQRGSVTAQLLLLGALFVVVDLIIDGPIGLLAGRIGALLRRRRRALRAFNIGIGSLFVGLSVRLAVTR